VNLRVVLAVLTNALLCSSNTIFTYPIEIKEENTKLTTNDSKEHIARGPIRSSAREAKKARMEERKQRIKELKAQKEREANK